MSSQTTGSTTIVWSDTVSVENVQKKRQELLKAFNSSDTILLDISKIEDIDISAVQLIIASQKEAVVKRKTFRVVGELPPSFIDFFCRIGISIGDIITAEQFSTEVLEHIAGETDA